MSTCKTFKVINFMFLSLLCFFGCITVSLSAETVYRQGSSLDVLDSNDLDALRIGTTDTLAPLVYVVHNKWSIVFNKDISIGPNTGLVLAAGVNSPFAFNVFKHQEDEDYTKDYTMDWSNDYSGKIINPNNNRIIYEGDEGAKSLFVLIAKGTIANIDPSSSAIKIEAAHFTTSVSDCDPCSEHYELGRLCVNNRWVEGCCRGKSHCQDSNPCTIDSCNVMLNQCTNSTLIAGCTICQEDAGCLNNSKGPYCYKENAARPDGKCATCRNDADCPMDDLCLFENPCTDGTCSPQRIYGCCYSYADCINRSAWDVDGCDLTAHRCWHEQAQTQICNSNEVCSKEGLPYCYKEDLSTSEGRCGHCRDTNDCTDGTADYCDGECHYVNRS